jgi:hypothetical protein
VNTADYTLWRSHFGNPMGAGSGANLSTSTVPEPTACVLLAIGALLSVAPRRPRRAVSPKLPLASFAELANSR